MTDTLTPLAAPGTFPVPAGRGRWRLTLHTRTFFTDDVHAAAGPTANQTILAELTNAAGRQLVQQWNTPAQLTFTVDGHTPAAAVIAELQHDIYAWRWDDQTGADVCVFRGVIDHSEDQIDEQSHTVTFTCHDYLAMIGRRVLLDGTQNYVFTGFDQDRLAAQLIAWGNGSYIGATPGSYLPVGVCAVDPTGATRAWTGINVARTYMGGQALGTGLDDLCRSVSFDYDIIPEPQVPDSLPAWSFVNVGFSGIGAGRDAIRIFYPRQGVTRTDLALVYGSTVSAVHRTVDSSAYANYVRVLGNNGTATTTAAQLYSHTQNSDAAGTTVGLWEFADNAPDVTLQATLDQQAAADLAYYGVLTPTYTLTMRPGAYSWGFPNMGDTVPLVVQSGRLNVNTNVRVVGITYNVGDDGQEDVTLTVGRPPQTLGGILNATQADVNALARR
jgi:hypothetical protein